MNNELLQREWGELVGDARAGCGALLLQYDDSIIAADELIKEQQAEIEHYNNQLDRACGDGNTPADFDKLREANLALAMESHQQQAHIERLRDKAKVAASELVYLIDKHNIHNMEDNSYLYDHQTPHELMSVLNETPPQSLEAVKREWQVETKTNHALVLVNARRLIKAHKSTSNGRLCSEIFGMGCGTGRQYCRELGLDPDSNETNFTVMIEFILEHNDG